MMKVLRGAAGVTLGLIAAVALAVLVLPRLLGWSAYVVTSGSMEPTFGPGSVVVAGPTEPTAVATDDIVIFRDASGGYTTHRVIGITAASVAGEQSLAFTTKGDANEEADPAPLDPRNLIGEAKFAVPQLGFLVEFVKAPLGAGLLAALFLLVIFSGGSRHPRKSTGEGSVGPSKHKAATAT